MGWAGVKKRRPDEVAEVEFDVFVTVDRNLSYQQRLPKYSVALIVLKARSNRYIDLIPFAEPVGKCLGDLRKGEAFLIDAG